eukprot:CCRYP_000445-RD/>CCRYP_000445-RD protein AED:0.02 eAED:0.02 QI:275/1/1/1/1/1/3/925/365
MPTSSATMSPTPQNQHNKLDAFDGGPPVDRRESGGSSMSDGSNRKVEVDDFAVSLSPTPSNGVKKSEYYNGEDFDDMIADVMEMEPSRRNGSNSSDQYEDDEEARPANVVDVTPDDKSMSTSSDPEEAEMNSLNSDDISGGSDISDVEEQARRNNKKDSKSRNFVPPPLINDDESTVDMRPPAPVNQSVSSYVEALNQQQNRKNRIVRFGVMFILLGVVIGVVLAIVSVSGGNKNGDGDASSVVGANGEYIDTNNQISVKDSLNGVANSTTYSPTVSPVYFESHADTMMPSLSSTIRPTLPPSLPPQTALPTSRPSPEPTEAEIIVTNAPVAAPVFFTDPPVGGTNSPVTPEPTPAVSAISCVTS